MTTYADKLATLQSGNTVASFQREGTSEPQRLAKIAFIGAVGVGYALALASFLYPVYMHWFVYVD